MTTGKIFKSLIKIKRDNSDNHWRGSASTGEINFNKNSNLINLLIRRFQIRFIVQQSKHDTKFDCAKFVPNYAISATVYGCVTLILCATSIVSV